MQNDGNFYAAPTATVTDVYSQRSWAEVATLASRGSRLAASILDGLPFMIVALLAGAAVVLLESTVSENMLIVLFLVGAGIALLAVMGINLYLLHQNGQTIGKKLMGIKIVRSDQHTRATLSRLVFLRAGSVMLMGMVPVIGSLVQLANYLYIFREDQRCLHDHIADTVVIVDLPGTQSSDSVW
jgi:uncharacterized RDD family membrane protein YckC